MDDMMKQFTQCVMPKARYGLTVAQYHELVDLLLKKQIYIINSIFDYKIDAFTNISITYVNNIKQVFDIKDSDEPLYDRIIDWVQNAHNT